MLRVILLAKLLARLLAKRLVGLLALRLVMLAVLPASWTRALLMQRATQLAPLLVTLLATLLAKLLAALLEELPGRLLVLRVARRGGGVALAMWVQHWGCTGSLLTRTTVTSWLRLRGRMATRACTRRHCNSCGGTIEVRPSVRLGQAAG